MANYVVYCATNKTNGKKYVGQTNDFEKRQQDHFNNMKYPYKQFAFSGALNKYGKEAFEWEILSKHRTLEGVNKSEEWYIAHLNTLAPNGYNLVKGGSNHEPSEETKEKIRAKLKVVGSLVGKSGKDHPAYGRHPTEERKKAQSIALSGENAPLAKLTTKNVRQIYKRFLKGATVAALTEEYGLRSDTTIMNILKRKCWKDATKNLPDADTSSRNRGAWRFNSKFTDNDIVDILFAAKQMQCSMYEKCISIGEEYDVSASCIRGILSGSSWKHIPRT